MSTVAVAVDAAAPTRNAGRSVVRDGALVGASTLAASAANYAANVMLGRELEARAFADAAMVISGMLLLSAIALGLQLTVARSVCTGAGRDAQRRIERRSFRTGIAVGLVVALLAPVIATSFGMESAVPIVLLGASVPVFFSLAVRRGVLQARSSFGRLAASQFVEPVVRLSATFVALMAGLGASSAAVGLLAAFATGWVVARDHTDAPTPSATGSTAPAIAATVLLLVGQVVIANGDLWIVSAVRPSEAGVYAAVALIGRLVYVASWSIVTVLFPTLVGGTADARAQLLRRGLAATALVGGALSAVAFAVGDGLVVGMVGDGYSAAGDLLGPYALATTLFVMANLVAVSDVAAGRRLLPFVMTCGALVQTVALVPLAGFGLRAVVLGQLGAMCGLLVVTLSVSCARR